jgi:formate dehydrogenase assembly factor FdhD
VSAALQRIVDLRRACELAQETLLASVTAWTHHIATSSADAIAQHVYACHAAWYEAQEALLHAQGMHAAAEYLAAERLAAAIARSI